MEEIARRRPIDRTAARVTAAGPKGYESSKKILTAHSATPFPMRPVPREMHDLTALQRGRLTVVGLAVRDEGAAKDKKALWVCRCVCGYYTKRYTKAIRNPNNDKDGCDNCREVDYLRRVSTYQQLGYNPDETDR